MLRWKRVEISAGALLLGAALYYLDEQGVLLMAFCACALHELGHWLVIRALGGRVTALRITCVGAEMRLSARCPLGYWQQIAAALAGPAVNLLAARMAAGLGTEGAYCFAGLNLALAAFNLLPAVQLDGGRILWCILALLTSEERAERLLRVLSSALAVGLVLGALLLLWQGRGNLTLLITAVWLLVPPAAKPCRGTRMGWSHSKLNAEKSLTLFSALFFYLFQGLKWEKRGDEW